DLPEGRARDQPRLEGPPRGVTPQAMEPRGREDGRLRPGQARPPGVVAGPRLRLQEREGPLDPAMLATGPEQAGVRPEILGPAPAPMDRAPRAPGRTLDRVGGAVHGIDLSGQEGGTRVSERSGNSRVSTRGVVKPRFSACEFVRRRAVGS